MKFREGSLTAQDRNHKYLVTVPDGLIEENKIVEIQCPVQAARCSMETLATTEEDFCLEISSDGRLKLKGRHHLSLRYN